MRIKYLMDPVPGQMQGGGGGAQSVPPPSSGQPQFTAPESQVSSPPPAMEAPQGYPNPNTYFTNGNQPAAQMQGAHQAQPTAPQGQGFAGSPAQGQSSQAQQEYDSIIDLLKQRGVQGNWTNDAEAFETLVNRYQQAAVPSFEQQLGTMVLPYADEFREFMAARQAQQAQQQVYQEPPPPENPLSAFQPPEWKPEWARFVQADPNGSEYVVPAPGADPRYAHRANEYLKFKAEAPYKFLQEAPALIERLVEDRAQRIAAQVAEQQIGRYQETMRARTIIQQNSEWMLAKDANGNLIRNRNGQPVYSPQGQLYYQTVKGLADRGVTDMNVQHQLAMQAVQNQAMRSHIANLQSRVAQTPGATHQPQSGSGRAVAPSREDVVPGSQGQRIPDPERYQGNAGRTLLDEMMSGMRDEGITEEIFRQQLNNPGGYNSLS